MDKELLRMKELKISREKNIKKLTRMLNGLVNLEWEISTMATKTQDNISKLASKSVAESASYIQTAISKLISTEINFLSEKNNEETSSSKKDGAKLQSLRKVILNKK